MKLGVQFRPACVHRHTAAVVVVHIQQDEARDYYGLDDLYGDCPKLDWHDVPVSDTGALTDA